MEEKFSVSLELMIQKFKDNAQKAQNIARNVASRIKQNMSVNVDTYNIEKLKIRLKDLQKEKEGLLSTLNVFDKMSDATKKLNAEKLEQVKNRLSEIDLEIEKINNTLNKTSNTSGKTFKNVNNIFDKGIKKAKRFTMSLFGLYSTYRILSKASSSYLAHDEETTQKIQSAWIGLGSVFAPLLSTIANFAIKAVSYINVFIKALTGVDFLANAMKKSMDKANKSAGKLSKTLAGFDEITNLDDSAGGASVDTSWIDAFKNVELDQNVVAWLEKVAEKTKPILNIIKEIGGAIKDIWIDILAPLFIFIIDNWDGTGKNVIGGLLSIGIALDLATGNWKGLIFKFVGFVILYWDEIKVGAQVLMEVIKTIFKTGFTVLVGMVTTPIELIKGIINSITSTVTGVIDGVKKIFNGLIKFITGVFKGDWKRAWEGIKDVFSGIFTVLGNVIKLPLNLIIDGLNAIVTGVNKIVIGGLNKLLELGKLVGIEIKIPTIPKIPKLEVGTNYVPNDTMAQLHKGEAVIPKKFNSDEYFSRLGTNNSEETNRLLEELIDRVERIEINPYITITDIGQAAQKYRTQQSRIMGEELS